MPINMKNALVVIISMNLLFFLSCTQSQSPVHEGASSGHSLKVAYVNGDSILHQYVEFRKASEHLDKKQQAAEQQLQQKSDALQGEIEAYQRKAQSGTLLAQRNAGGRRKAWCNTGRINASTRSIAPGTDG